MRGRVVRGGGGGGGGEVCVRVVPKGGRDETCPISTGGGTRRVQSVREGGGGWKHLGSWKPLPLPALTASKYSAAAAESAGGQYGCRTCVQSRALSVAARRQGGGGRGVRERARVWALQRTASLQRACDALHRGRGGRREGAAARQSQTPSQGGRR